MSYERPTFELPGEAAAGKRPPSRTSGLQVRQGAAHFPRALHQPYQYSSPAPAVVLALRGPYQRVVDMRGRAVSHRTPSVVCDRHLSLLAPVQCEHPAALRSSAAGSFQAVTPLPLQAPSEESRPSTPR